MRILADAGLMPADPTEAKSLTQLDPYELRAKGLDEPRRKYRVLKSDCDACPKVDARSVTREEHEDAREIARAFRTTKTYTVSRDKRKKVERLFARLKRILGLGRLRLRGPCGVSDEFLLAATAQNLRKLAKILPAPQQPQST